MGELRGKNALHVATRIDPQTSVLLAQNPYNTDFDGRVAFVASSELARSFTADRTEFLGRNGTLANPAAMGRTRLSGKTGVGFDPCAALQVQIELEPNQERDITFVIGAGQNLDQVRDLARRLQNLHAGQDELSQVWEFWSRTLGAVRVETPEPALDLLANGWLLYQVISCRLWGAYRLLPVRGRLWLSRSACRIPWCWSTPRREVAPRTTAARRRPHVSRGRCPTLVAPAAGQGSA